MYNLVHDVFYFLQIIKIKILQRYSQIIEMVFVDVFLFVQCFVYYWLYFCPFSFGHYIDLSFHLQIPISPLVYSNVSCMHSLLVIILTVNLRFVTSDYSFGSSNFLSGIRFIPYSQIQACFK
jgi:hypothetical protein